MASELSASSRATLPDYIQAAQPNPPSKRAPWYLNTAPTYAGVFLWFAFWDPMAGNGLGRGGVATILLGVILAGLICHFLFYLVPALFGLKTGLPLYIVGSSTFGALGSLIMPGFLMGLLQFGWLAVNAYFSSEQLTLGILGAPNRASADPTAFNSIFFPLCVIWPVAAAFIGLKGIQYVAKVATFLPLIPLAVLILALVSFAGGAANYDPEKDAALRQAGVPIDPLGGLLLMVGAIVGFFATAGAAGVDFGTNSRDRRDVQLGGLVGIFVATIFTAGAAVLVIAGARAHGVLTAGLNEGGFVVTNALPSVVDPTVMRLIRIGLPIAALPGACFSSFIAANSFKTVMPRVNPLLSVGAGTLVSIVLAVTGLASRLPDVFSIIGASFGPICGAMFVDYLLAGRRWTGPRAGFNPAGWIAWALGFIVGILPTFKVPVPAAPVAAFLVGAVVYFVLAKAGMQSPVLPYGPAKEEAAA